MVVNLLSLVLVLSIAGAVESGGGAESSLEKARSALEPLDKEFEAARDKLSARLAELYESEAYKDAREKREYQKARDLSEKITAPFYEKWRERYRRACKPYVGSVGEIAFADAVGLHVDLHDLGEDVRKHKDLAFALVGVMT